MKTILGSFLMMTVLTACQQSVLENNVSDELHMSLVASIGNPKNTVTSRYAGIDPNNVSFYEGDEIGLFVDEQSAVKWVYSNQKWNPDKIVYWPDKDQNHIFKAFYPYEESSSLSEVKMPTLLGQTGYVDCLGKHDFLIASAEQSYEDDGVVEFKGGNAFEHVSSLIQLTLDGTEDLKNSTITEITIKGQNIVAPSTYSFDDKEVTLKRDDNSDQLTIPLDKKMNGTNFSFYVVLNEKLDNTSKVVLAIKYTTAYTTGNKDYVAELENFAGNVFQGGVCQQFRLKIKDSSLIVSGSSILPWDEGTPLDDIVVDGKVDE